MSVLDKFKLTDRIALVTGGNRGLGKQMALALAEAGASVALTSRDQGRADQAAEEIAQSLVDSRAANAENGLSTQEPIAKVRGYACEVSDHEQASQVVQQVIADFGGLHILVNNAGINIRGPIDELQPEEFSKGDRHKRHRSLELLPSRGRSPESAKVRSGHKHRLHAFCHRPAGAHALCLQQRCRMADDPRVGVGVGSL